MPSDISNALGTERQFTPQPDSGYVGRYQGVSPSAVQASVTGAEQLAQNMAQLSAALGSYLVSHEHYLYDKGSIEAERMIKGESEEDIRKLNAIDAAQQEGYADSLSNPYFKAHAERLRGTFVASVMKEQYDERYSMTPARSAAEEAKRYNDFSKDWQEKNLSGQNAPVNMTAFSAGFNENQLVNVGNLMSTWEKKDHENKIAVTMAQAQSQLGDIINNSVELLKTNGAVTHAAQEVFNNLRLMGLPPEYRQKLLQDFVDQFIQTGHIGADRLGQMLENLVIQTNIDGSTEKASDLLDLMRTKTMAAEYNRQFYTQEKADFIDKYVKQGDAGKKAARAYIEELRVSDPEKAREFNSLIPAIDNGVEVAKAKAEAARRAAMASKGRGGGKAGSRVSDPQSVSSLIEGWLKGSTMVGGKPIGSYTIDQDALYSVAVPYLQQYIRAGDTANFTRLMDMPQLKSLRSTIADDIASTLAGILPSDDGGVNIGGNPELMSFVKGVMDNPGAIAHTFGGSLAAEAYTLKTLSVANGGGQWGFEQALRLYALSHQTERQNPDVHSANKTLAANSMAGYTIEDVPSAHDIDSLTDTADFGLGCNDLVRDDLTKVWGTLLDAGYSQEAAMGEINRLVRSNYETYHWGIYPQSCHFNLGTVNDPYFFKKAIDEFIYDTAGIETVDTEATTISYNPATQAFFFECRTNGATQNVTLSQLRDMADKLYKNYNKGDSGSSDTGDSGIDIDAVNKARIQYGNSDDTSEDDNDLFTYNGRAD
jgi:hypothetical protein